MTSRWKPGESGNPNGRPTGSPNKASILRAEMIEAATVRTIVEKLVAAALDGDVQAAVALLDRTMPKLRPVSAPVEFALPNGVSLTEQGRAVLAAVSDGRLPPDVGERLVVALGALARLSEIDELAARVAVLESKHG